MAEAAAAKQTEYGEMTAATASASAWDEVKPELRQCLVDAVHSSKPVSGLTHDFYRYPARFSPLFARAAIRLFTEPGDIVFDPFMGGGTVLVEARAIGRRALGTDISSLATFVTQAKTTILPDEQLEELRFWTATLAPSLNCRRPPARVWEWIQQGYQRNISNKTTWPIRKLIELALAQVKSLASIGQQRMARCIVLRTAQWALDCRPKIPTATEFRRQFQLYATTMIQAAKDYASVVRAADPPATAEDQARTLCLHRSVVGIEEEPSVVAMGSPKLILTSPPYPGVHVLYHRWQVQGRKETPAPFWIANSLDGNGASYYTFGDRRRQGLAPYYDQALSAFSSISKIASPSTIIVQLIAFADPAWQLGKYLEVMEKAGLIEISFPHLTNSPDGRLWRRVPNRKWYADQRGATDGSNEVVLFHRLA